MSENVKRNIFELVAPKYDILTLRLTALCDVIRKVCEQLVLMTAILKQWRV